LQLWEELNNTGLVSAGIFPEKPRHFGMSRKNLNSGEWGTSLIASPEHLSNPDVLADAVRNLRRLGELKGIVPGDESAVPLCDQLAALLGLPGNDPATSNLRTIKGDMQRAARDFGLLIPETRKATTEDQAVSFAADVYDGQSGYVVLKPPDSASSVGVTICEYNEAAIRRAWRNTIGMPGALGRSVTSLAVQQFLAGGKDGRKWTVDTVTIRPAGHARPYHLVTDVWREKVNVVKGGGVAWGESRLVGDPTDKDALAVSEYARQVLDAVGVEVGPANVEVIFTDKGPRLVEVASRPAGIYPFKLVKNALGRSQLSCIAEALANPSALLRHEQIGSTNLAIAQVWLQSPGRCRLEAESLERLFHLPGVVSASPELKRKGGRLVRRTVSTPTSPGFFNLCGSPKVIDDTIRRIREEENKDPGLYRAAT
jgi:hypothetical protein